MEYYYSWQMASLSLYRPLSLQPPQVEIRLLEILDTTDGTVSCRLTTAPLNSQLRYAALSYVWGYPSKTEDITLDGTAVAVTTNLASALRYVKKHWESIFPDNDKGSFRLWVDAVCLCVDRYQRKYHRNLRFGPLFSEGFRFAL
jgi:hypothetical protein